MGADRGDDQGPDVIPSSGGATYHGDDGETWGWRRAVLFSSRGGDGLCRDPTNWSIYQKSAYNYSGDVGLPACLRTVHGGGEDSGYEPDGAMVGSRRGK